LSRGVDPVGLRTERTDVLYRLRWHAGLEIRSLKITPGMDMLRCKSPGGRASDPCWPPAVHLEAFALQ
jgi:hypothetical protein